MKQAKPEWEKIFRPLSVEEQFALERGTWKTVFEFIQQLLAENRQLKQQVAELRRKSHNAS